MGALAYALKFLGTTIAWPALKSVDWRNAGARTADAAAGAGIAYALTGEILAPAIGVAAALGVNVAITSAAGVVAALFPKE